MEQYIDEENGDGSPPHSLKSILTTSATAPEIMNDCYDCNICLDNAQDPVVTICGHLYCWPCIYKWLNSECNSTTIPEDHQRQCPVCKSIISKTTLVPLYGRGQTEPKEKKSFIPSRPKATGVQALITTSTTSTSAPSQPTRRYHYDQPPQHLQLPQNRRHYYDGYGTGLPTTPSGLHPLVGMLGEMVYSSIFGNTEASYYWYPNSYQHMTSSSPRIRRQEMQAERSLNRISIFLFCCVVLCLLLF